MGPLCYRPSLSSSLDPFVWEGVEGCDVRCICCSCVKADACFPQQQDQSPRDAMHEQDVVAWKRAGYWGAASVEGTLGKIPMGRN